MKPLRGCYLFGVYKACIGIKDCVVLIHSITGCNFGTLIYHLSNNLEDVHQACSVIYEDEVISGGESRLEKALQQVETLYPNNKSVIVISGCVPHMVGDDVEEVIRKTSIKNEVYHIPAPGMSGDELIGYEAALLKFTEIMSPQPKKENAVNIIGMSCDDPRAESDLLALNEILTDQLKINTVFGFCSLEEIKIAPQAELNIVFGRGLKLAQYMEKNYSVPYIIADYPYGIKGIIALQEKVAEKMTKVNYASYNEEFKKQVVPQLTKITHYLRTLQGLPVAVIGDIVHTQGLKTFLENELGMSVTATSSDAEKDSDVIYDEVRASEAILIFGSSFEQGLADELNIPLIHFTYPVFDEIFLGNKPLLGRAGLMNLLETIINSCLGHKYKKQGSFFNVKLG